MQKVTLYQQSGELRTELWSGVIPYTNQGVYDLLHKYACRLFGRDGRDFRIVQDLSPENSFCPVKVMKCGPKPFEFLIIAIKEV